MSDVVNESELTEEEKAKRFKQMKKEAADRFKKKRAEEKAAAVEAAKSIINFLKVQNLWDGLAVEGQEWLSEIARPKATANQNMFKVLFGETPQVGDTITLAEAFQKTLKGKSNIDFYVKRWAAKGILVSYSQSNENLLDSTYKIETLPSNIDEDSDEDQTE